MILVDSSVWIDYFRGAPSAETDLLDRLLGSEPLLVGDLIVVEVLQGFRTQREFTTARRLLNEFEVVALCSPELAIQAARNYRELHNLGITVRKTIDTVIATYCIENNHPLLTADRDFEPFVSHLGLIRV